MNCAAWRGKASLCLAFGLVALFPRFAAADEMAPAFAKGAGIVDQIISVSFEPQVYFILREAGPGVVKQYKAAALELHDAEPGSRKFIVGSYIPSGTDDFHFSFFLAAENSAFAASEIKRWNEDDLRKNTTSTTVLEQRIAELEDKIKIKRVEAADLEEQLTGVRARASELAGVDKIIKLKTKLHNLEQTAGHDKSETERLKELTDNGRELEDPEDIDQYRKELSANLEEAAKVTAVAERLNQRKKESAKSSFMKKVELVKQMDTSDPDDLAREILQLRRKRREFENRLGLTSEDGGSREF